MKAEILYFPTHIITPKTEKYAPRLRRPKLTATSWTHFSCNLQWTGSISERIWPNLLILHAIILVFTCLKHDIGVSEFWPEIFFWNFKGTLPFQEVFITLFVIPAHAQHGLNQAMLRMASSAFQRPMYIEDFIELSFVEWELLWFFLVSRTMAYLKWKRLTNWT